MKAENYSKWIGLLGLAALMTACGQSEVVEIPAVGDIVTERYDLAGFDEVEVAGFFKAQVTQGEDFKVLVEVERALIPYLEVRLRGDRLSVGLESGVRYSLEDASQRVEVTLPVLNRARVSNHSTLRLDGFETEDALRLDVADFSTLRASIAAWEIQVDVSNHSSLVLSGSATKIGGEVIGLSAANLTQLDVDDVDIAVDEISSLKE